MNLQPIGVRLGPDGKFTAIPQPQQELQQQQQPQQVSDDGDKSYTQSEMDQVIDMLEAKLTSMQSDNERLKVSAWESAAFIVFFPWRSFPINMHTHITASH